MAMGVAVAASAGAPANATVIPASAARILAAAAAAPGKGKGQAELAAASAMATRASGGGLSGGGGGGGGGLSHAKAKRQAKRILLDYDSTINPGQGNLPLSAERSELLGECGAQRTTLAYERRGPNCLEGQSRDRLLSHDCPRTTVQVACDQPLALVPRQPRATIYRPFVSGAYLGRWKKENPQLELFVLTASNPDKKKEGLRAAGLLWLFSQVFNEA